MEKSTWELFDEAFKIGDDVVLIDDDDKFIVGKLTQVEDDCCFIGDQCAYWNNVRFICHDGFPVRKLKGADGSKLIATLDTKKTQELIRETLVTSICVNCGKLFSDDHLRHTRQCTECFRVVFGDPFMVEGVSAKLYNVGNSSPYFWKSKQEECLVLKAKDKAIAQLFDLSTIYCYEAL